MARSTAPGGPRLSRYPTMSYNGTTRTQLQWAYLLKVNLRSGLRFAVPRVLRKLLHRRLH